MKPMLADMPAAVQKRLEAKVERLRPDEDKMKGTIEMNDHPRAVAPFLEDVAKVARIPAPGSARVAMELLVSIAQSSLPEWENVGDRAEERPPFDEAVDELYVVLARQQRDGEGENFNAEGVLEEIRAIAGELKELSIPSCFKRSIELLEPWTGSDTDSAGEPEPELQGLHNRTELPSFPFHPRVYDAPLSFTLWPLHELLRSQHLKHSHGRRATRDLLIHHLLQKAMTPADQSLGPRTVAYLLDGVCREEVETVRSPTRAD